MPRESVAGSTSRALPDFENPMDMNRDNVYEVTLTVVDTSGLMGEKNIRITVNNVDEKGKLTIAPAQPHLDGMVVATLTDPDGVESITDWKWASATSTGGMFGDHSRCSTTPRWVTSSPKMTMTS